MRAVAQVHLGSRAVHRLGVDDRVVSPLYDDDYDDMNM
jgi:hypothetical protein